MQHTHIKVSTARHDQIKRIAEAKGLTIAGLIAEWVRREIAQGTIPPGIPGVVVEIDTADHAGLTLGELRLDPTCDEARELSTALREIADGHRKALEAKYSIVKRNGPGLTITSPFTGRKFVLGKDTAHELADQIEDALEKQKGAA